ncbi:hypothetical protein SAMN05661080_01498 [Modestobacter sp. DSM 44400]|nr:hypothetical protein [Modestobacter sp. DSM 44400]SDX86741.1 hypothetical protein SAMN05661080_01498 [Modestobacter sp. DSM 44400]
MRELSRRALLGPAEPSALALAGCGALLDGSLAADLRADRLLGDAQP